MTDRIIKNDPIEPRPITVPPPKPPVERPASKPLPVTFTDHRAPKPR